MDEIRNKIKFRNPNRNEIYQYWDMNNKLINKSIDLQEKDRSYAYLNEDAKYFKDHKNLTLKVMNQDKMKSTIDKKFNKVNENGVRKVTEFCKMNRDLSKIQLKKNIIAKERETEKNMLRSKSSIKGRNLFNDKDY